MAYPVETTRVCCTLPDLTIKRAKLIDEKVNHAINVAVKECIFFLQFYGVKDHDFYHHIEMYNRLHAGEGCKRYQLRMRRDAVEYIKLNTWNMSGFISYAVNWYVNNKRLNNDRA